MPLAATCGNRALTSTEQSTTGITTWVCLTETQLLHWADDMIR